jgi:hypothetical protein
MLVIRAGTPRGSKPAESGLMKAPAPVVAPIHRMSAWQQEEREGNDLPRGSQGLQRRWRKGTTMTG